MQKWFIIKLETEGYWCVRWLHNRKRVIYLKNKRITSYPLLALGDSFSVTCGCFYCLCMLRLQIQPIKALILLIYPYRPPFCFQKGQPQTIPTCSNLTVSYCTMPCRILLVLLISSASSSPFLCFFLSFNLKTRILTAFHICTAKI